MAVALGTSIEDVSLAELGNYSRKLALKIKESGYVPTHVLCVERAGLLVGYEVANFFECTMSGIYSSRSGHSLKSKAKIILRYLPRSVTHLLRNIEFKSKVHEIKKDRHVYIESQFPPKGKNLLLVDDAIDTGYSLKAVLDFMETQGYNRQHIKIAVLTTTLNNPVCRPDISLFDQVSFAFPWSYDSKEYDRTWKLYDTIKASMIIHES